MALSYALTTYAHLQAWLQRDVEIVLAEELIDAATRAIEGHCNRAFVQRTVTAERHNVEAKQKRLYLYHAPIAAVSSIADDNSGTVASTDYEIEWGYLEHHAYWPLPTYRWAVTYTAGDIATVAAVTNDLRLAAHRFVAHALAGPQGPIIAESRAEVSTSYAAQDGRLPPDVAVLVDHYRRVSV